MSNYYSTKTYGHNIGLSAVFRQPHADGRAEVLREGQGDQLRYHAACAPHQYGQDAPDEFQVEPVALVPRTAQRR